MCRFDKKCTCEFLNEQQQQPPETEIKEIIRDPIKWHKSQEERLKLASAKARELYYLLTFTRNPSSRYDVDQWLERVNLELRKAHVLTAKAGIEHVHSNVHVHAYVLLKYPLSRKITNKSHPLFVFRRDFGGVDIERETTDCSHYPVKDLPPEMEAASPQDDKYALRKMYDALLKLENTQEV